MTNLPPQPSPGGATRYRNYAWAFLAYLIAVALFGAWVRITHSGAGCGDHWPSCHGQIVPLSPSAETIIEFTHRASTGLLGVVSLVLLGWAYKLYGWRHRVTLAAIVTNAFIVFESLIGAKLVLSELVVDNDSVARAAVIALHLGNTLALTGAAALCAWWSGAPQQTHPPRTSLPPRTLRPLFAIAILAIVLTSMMGAITALGDTLFPVDPTLGHGLFDRVRQDLSTANHFLVRLRIIHPVMAVVVSIFLIVLTSIVRTIPGATARSIKVAHVLLTAVILQLGIGAMNIWLAAPGWMQLVHLAFAQIVWIALLISADEALASAPAQAPE